MTVFEESCRRELARVKIALVKRKLSLAQAQAKSKALNRLIEASKVSPPSGCSEPSADPS